MPDLSREERAVLREDPRPSVVRAMEVLDAAEQRAEKAEADAERLAEALRAAWPGLSGESYDRPISEVHDLAREALAQHERERA